MDPLSPSPPPIVAGSPVPAGSDRNSRPSGLGGSSIDIGIDLDEILRILRRRAGVILGCIVVVTAIGAVNVLQIVPRYTAESSVMLDARKTQVVDVQAVLSGLPADMAVIHSEVEVLKSPSIAEHVTKALNLTASAEFNPSLRRPVGIGQKLGDLIDRLQGKTDAERPAKQAPSGETAASLPEPTAATIQAAANILRAHTEINNEARSYVLKIRVDSEDPQMAAAIANAYADAYLDSQLEAKFNAVRRANNWLNDHLTELRTKVEDTDHAVQLFKSQHNLTETRGMTVNAQQLGELNTQLMMATADRAQKDSNLKQIQQQIQANGGDADAQVLASPLIQSLREQETKLLSTQAQLATKYKAAHPTMINLEAEKRDLQQKIQEEINKIVRGMTGEVAAAQAKEASLRENLQKLQKSLDVQGEAEVQLRQLEREAESNRALYQNFLQRFKQTSAQEDSQQADARLLAQAQVPSVPSYPHTSRFLMMYFGGSVLLGILAAFIIEQMDPGFRTREQFERLTHVPLWGLVPDLVTGASPIDIIAKDPICPYSEAIRTIRTALRYADQDQPPKVVMVTSSLPAEGKSVFSISLARSMACSGGRALIIDCDLRQPSVASLLNITPKFGLLALFEDGVDLEDVAVDDNLSTLKIIAGSPGTPNPQDLLASDQMAALIDKLRASYDLIVLDTPPVLAVSDALILSHLADTTIYLVHWGKSARSVVTIGLKSFMANGGKLAGAILTRVNMKRHSGYSYGEDEYAYGRSYVSDDRLPR